MRWCNNAVSTDNVQFILDEHFTLAGNFWTCPELDDLREQAMKQRGKLSEAGRIAGLKSAAKRRASTTVERPLNDRQPRDGDGDGDGEEKDIEKKIENGISRSASILSKEPSLEEFPIESIPPRGPQRWALIKSLREDDPKSAERFIQACNLKDAA